MPDIAYIITRGETYIIPLLAVVDGYHTENHTFRLSTTSYPVESGGALTDNAVREPNIVRLSGVVSDVLAAYHSSVYPGKNTVAWAAIYNLINDRTLVEIVTKIAVYSNMIITRCETTRDVNTGSDALRFEITLQEILRAQSRLIVETVSDPTTTSPAVGRKQADDLGRLSAEPLEEYIDDADAPAQPSPNDGILRLGDRLNETMGRAVRRWLSPATIPMPTPFFGSVSPNLDDADLGPPFSTAIPSRLPSVETPLMLPTYTVSAPAIHGTGSDE